jgi:hypothetical protein
MATEQTIRRDLLMSVVAGRPEVHRIGTGDHDNSYALSGVANMRSLNHLPRAASSSSGGRALPGLSSR